MALEAQLCPQCGATVQFADAQTAVVCSYCGTTVAKTEAQEVLKVNDLKELSEADNQKLENLVLDGRRQDAIYFIRHYTGLGDEHANAAIDNIITAWDGDHVQEGPVSAGRVIWSLIILAINAAILLVIAAYFTSTALAATTARQRNATFGAGIGVCGGLSAPFIFWAAYSFFQVQGTWQKLQVSVNRRSGQVTPGLLRKVVALKAATPAAGAPITTRLQIELPAAAGQPPQVVDRALDLPPATVDSLKPGTRIEVITHGPAFTYVPTPIKVMG